MVADDPATLDGGAGSDTLDVNDGDVVTLGEGADPGSSPGQAFHAETRRLLALAVSALIECTLFSGVMSTTIPPPLHA